MVHFMQSLVLGAQRMIRRNLTVILLLAVAFCAWPQFARAQESQLVAAAKAMEKRDYGTAVDKIGEAFKSGKMDNAGTAKGFLMRGECHAKLDKQAQALSDFNNAIWLQSLSSDDRAKAVDGRKRAMDALGVADNSPDAGRSGDTASPSSSSSGLGNVFGGLFGSSSSSAPAAQEAKAPPPSTWAAAPAQDTRSAATPATGPAPVQAAAATAAPDDTGQYTILLATVASEDKAQTEAKRMNSRLAGLLEGKVAEVRRLESGQTATFRVLAGPFEGRNHTREICESMKAKVKGVSCLVVPAAR